MTNFDENKKASMDDMENAAGGNYEETRKDQIELWKRGFFSKNSSDNDIKVGRILSRLGYTKCQINTGSYLSKYRDYKNVYADKDGNIMSREQFWKEFDEEFI